MIAYPYSVENLKVLLTSMPKDLLEYTYGFLPKGHPLIVSHEMDSAFRISSTITEITDAKKEQICSLVSQVFDCLVNYSRYITYLPWEDKNYSKMPVLLSRFAQRMPLHFDKKIRCKVRFILAECLKNKVIETKMIGYDAEVWVPILPLRIPYINEFGLGWKEPCRKKEWKVLKGLEDWYNDRIVINRNQGFRHCKCCGLVLTNDFEVFISKMISRFDLANTLIEEKSFFIVPVELSSLFVNNIIKKINIVREKSSDFFSGPVKKPDLKKFAGYLKKDILRRIDLLQVEIRTKTQIPAGSGDIPEILLKLDHILKMPDENNERMNEDDVLQPGQISINIQVSNENDRTWDRLLDNVTWMDHNFRLTGIVDLALKLVAKGYHVSLR